MFLSFNIVRASGPFFNMLIMDRYLADLATIRTQTDNLSPYHNLQRLTQFSFFGANMANFLPEVPYGKHLSYFKEASFHQQVSHLDQRYFTGELPFELVGWDAGLRHKLETEPGIICTLHMGSYRLINYLLANAGLSFSILMSRHTSARQGATFRQLFESLRGKHKTLDIQIIEAEDPGVVWKLSACLKRGMNILVYVDGDTGLPAQSHQLLKIPFLAQHLFVRKGVAFLADLLGKPLYPIICHRSDNNAVIVSAGSPIRLDTNRRGSGHELALTYLFAYFGSVIMRHPAQWENWFLLHHQIDVKHIDADYTETPQECVPQRDEYGLVCSDKAYFLLRKKGYNSYRINQLMYEGLVEKWAKISVNPTLV